MPDQRSRGSARSRARASGPRRAPSKGTDVRAGNRRWLVSRGAAILVVGAIAYVLFVPAKAPGAIGAGAIAAGRAAGCGDVTHPAASAPGGIHLQPGQSYTYTQHPATSGPHDPSPLPPDPHVYPSPIPETRAVHNLEHAYVLIYYRVDGEGALASDVVDALASLARAQARVIMAPYPDLPTGTALALAAWNTLWTCPANVTSDQATSIARGFIDAFRGTSIAPEPPRGLLGPILQK